MQYKNIHILIFVILIISISACSVKKNTATSRFYHAFTTRYNTHFNANEAYKTSLENTQDYFKDNYSALLYLHPVSASIEEDNDGKSSGNFNRTIEKCQKAIQEHSIKKKPVKNAEKLNDPKYRKFISRDEYNPFIHNTWLLMGKAQFYKGDFLASSATFLYISRHFTWLPDLVAESQLWIARCYTEMGWLYEAEDVLTKVNTAQLPKSLNGLFSNVFAGYLLKKGEYAKSIPYLETAIKEENNKNQKVRMRFLLAQLCTLTGNPVKAYQAFNQVLSMNPPYYTEFNARIQQSSVLSDKNSDKIIKQLKRMARNSKNEDFLDQVYYAIGNIYLSKKDTLQAIKNYETAINKSTRNGIEKALCQVVLGDLYFDKHDYINAQPAYAGAISIIPKKDKDYPRISKRSQTLDDLVIHAQAVHLQDSLQHLAALPEEQRIEEIQKIIDEIVRKEKEEAENSEREKLIEEHENRFDDFPPPAEYQNTRPNIPTPPSLAGDKSWYFYNKALISNGKTEFQRKWGSRRLEDNWRRKNKNTFAANDITENPTKEYTDKSSSNSKTDDKTGKNDSISSNGNKDKDIDSKSIEFYMNQLPLTPELLANSNEIIKDGLYNMGIILKNKLEDFKESIETFLTLDNRFPDNKYKLEIYYEIYLMYIRMNNLQLANVYKDKIIQNFTDSKYAVALKDPNYLDNLKNMDKAQNELYAQTYSLYLNGKYDKVQANYELMKSTYPLSKLMPKFMFLSALSDVSSNNDKGFKNTLKELLDKYPDSDVSPLAGNMMKGVAQGKTIVTGIGPNRGIIWKIHLSKNKADSVLQQTDSIKAKFTIDTDSPQMLVFAFASDSVNSKQLLFEVAKFNFSNFLIKDFDLELADFSGVSLILIKGFNNMTEVHQYRKLLSSEKGFAIPPGVRPILISESNYQILIKGYSFEDYFQFMESQHMPTTINR